ncbi:MAG: metallophosphoesterase, partial [Kiritimatiellia bacterium]
MVKIVNEFNPDLVAITGDFVTFNPKMFVEDLVSSLNELTPRDETVAILGNHDHWTDPDAIRYVMQTSGIRELSNDVLSLRRGDASLHISGLGDLLEGLDRLDLVLDRLPGEGAAILLAHEPDKA